MKVVVLAGGLSPERYVSLTSGTLVANALIENGHDVMLIDLYLGKLNKEFYPIYHNNKEKFRYTYNMPLENPDLKELKSLKDDDILIDKDIIDICSDADKVFLALHGSIGENGKLQSLLDIYNIKYTGTSSLGCMLSMHKDIAKRIMKSNNILTPSWKYINLNEEYEINTNYPIVVKPCSTGSSIGISIVNNQEELNNAIENAKKYEKEIILEEYIEGREFTVGILNNKPLEVIEIKPLVGFYDYNNKYQKGKTIEECPANIDNKTREELLSIALKVHKSLHLGQYSRIDFIIDKNNNTYCLEANTLPGMTPTSLLPQSANACNMNFNELCEIIIENR